MTVNYHGLLPRVDDTAIMASYVNENIPRGLKFLTKNYLGYEQVDYASVTQGRKMNQMTAAETLDYGADDTICTSAIHNFFQVIMEIEGTFDAYQKVEHLPQYVTAWSYVKGVKFSMERMLELERADAEVAGKNWVILNEFLIQQGWEGTVCPVFTADDLGDAKSIKLIYSSVTGCDLVTKVRTPAKLFALIRAADSQDASLLAHHLESSDIDSINSWVARRFDGRPVFDTSSPKQMKHLLYTVLNMPVRLVNKLTENERSSNKPLKDAVYKFQRLQKGGKASPMTAEELEIIKVKATTDDDAVAFALKFDAVGEAKTVLEAVQAIKTTSTRQSLFYTPYKSVVHWRTGRVHSNVKQCGTTTRRYAPSGPNLSQLPKKGEGVQFRENFVPHKRKAVVVSADFGAQELRSQASRSKDPGLIACYVGDNKKDMHSLTASQAFDLTWTAQEVDDFYVEFGIDPTSESGPYRLMMALRKHVNTAVAKDANDLRKLAKITNFLAAYGGTASSLMCNLVSDYQTADNFLKAKYAAFPRYEEWKSEVETRALRLGYATTTMGARRHLNASVDESWALAAAARQMSNYEIQGDCAEQTKLAMGRLWESDALFIYDVEFMFPVHDELVSSVAEEDVIPYVKILSECMTVPYYDDIEAIASISIGKNYGEQIECGDYFDAPEIEKALRQLSQEREAA